MAINKNFIPPSQDVLERAKTDKVFYVSAEGVLPKGIGLLNKFLPFNIPLIDIADLPVGVSPLGTLVFDNIVFLPGKYTTPNNPVGIPYKGLLINTCVFEARQQKNIVKTIVQGRSKSVKEYISGGDLNITINGMIVNNVFANFYPTRDVESFIQLMQVPKSLTVQSKFLDMLGVKHITIENWDLRQVAGQRNMQPFTINAIDDYSSEVNDITGTTI